MKIIRNNIIPFPGFKAINLFGVLFVRTHAHLTEEDINHEAIHTAQMKELLWVGFYIAYIVEWLYRFYKLRDAQKAYLVISFEREAYGNECYLEYLKNREHYAMWRGGAS